MKKKLLFTSLALAGIGAVVEYFFKFAMTPFNKTPDSKEITSKDPLYKEKLWFKNFKKQRWTLQVTPNLTLFANYLDNCSEKTVVLLHGFMSDGDSMAGFAKIFFDLGYNVLLPDARAHGRSAGKYIGYGWVEKDDILRWIKQIIAKNGKNQKIVVMGQSMGGATTMMVSGMKLPKQVKCFIEDCGYSNAKDEITFQAQNTLQMAEIICKPVVEAISGLNKIKNGFFLKDASSLKQLKKNTRPFLFIHGAKDQVVPSQMVYKNYAVTSAPKELWITPLARHSESFPMYKDEYREKVSTFLEKYVDEEK